MKIVSATIERFGGSLAREVANARRAWRAREGLLLRVSDEEGHVGQGEASPLPDYSPDTIEISEEVLGGAGEGLARGVLPGALDRMLRGVDRDQSLERELAELLAPMDPGSHPAARFALETALLDLLGQRAGRSVARLLGGSAPGRTIPVNAWIQSTTADAVQREVAVVLARGIRTVKLKLGRAGAFEEELALARALRREFGPGLALRFDANGVWGMDEAVGRLAALAEVGPEYVEQPVAAALLPELATSPATQATAVTLAADETLADREACRLLLGEEKATLHACRILILKPMVLGGLLRCRELARQGAARGMRVVVSHLLDGPVALAACAELALSLAPEPLACGLDAHPGLGAWPEVTIPQLGPHEIHSAAGGGLGLALLR